MPFGSVAQSEADGIPGANFQFPGFASHGRRYSPITTSSTSEPSALGCDQGQQNPAATRAVNPSPAFSRIALSRSVGESNILNSNPSVPSHKTFALRSTPSVLFIQLTTPAEPAHLNWTTSWNSEIAAPTAIACCLM